MRSFLNDISISRKIVQATRGGWGDEDDGDDDSWNNNDPIDLPDLNIPAEPPFEIPDLLGPDPDGGNGKNSGNEGRSPGAGDLGGSGGGVGGGKGIIEVDCNQKATQNSQETKTNYDNFKPAGLNDFINNYKGSDIEYGLSLYFKDGAYSPGTLSEGNEYNVTIKSSVYAVADVHNHPDNSPPSPGDAWGLANSNKDGHPNLETSFVVTPDGTIYALQIEDPDKAHTFATNNRITNPDGTYIADPNLLVELGAALNEIRTMGLYLTYADEYMYAMAAVLAANDSGIVISKLESNSFKQKNATENKNNPDTPYNLSTCK